MKDEEDGPSAREGGKDEEKCPASWASSLIQAILSCIETWTLPFFVRLTCVRSGLFSSSSLIGVRMTLAKNSRSSWVVSASSDALASWSSVTRRLTSGRLNRREALPLPGEPYTLL